MPSSTKISYSFAEMKASFIDCLTREDRCFLVRDNKSSNIFRIDVRAVNPHSTRRSCWQPGVIRNACEEVLARMNIARFHMQVYDLFKLSRKNVVPFTKNCFYRYLCLWFSVNCLFLDAKTMFHTPDISKDFILNKAVRDATNILLRPYMPDSPCISGNICEGGYNLMNHIIRQFEVPNLQQFLMQMTTIAWDFLNVLSICQTNIGRHHTEENI